MPVLKVLSRRKPSAIAHTLSYITREHDNGEVSPILHNLRSEADDHEAIAQEFLTNEAYRKVTSNRLYCFHTILSLGEGDKENTTPKTLQSIAQKFLELRGDILAYAVPHFDTDSHHIHILESATYYREDRSSSVRKNELQRIKTELEFFVEERFPELENSRVLHGAGKAYTKEAEYQLQKRTGTSERETLKKLVHHAFQKATSKHQFLDMLLDKGYVHYERNTDGVPTGVISESGRKYRFKTLGLLPENIMDLENQQEKTQEQNLLEQLKNIRQHNFKTREK